MYVIPPETVPADAVNTEKYIGGQEIILSSFFVKRKPPIVSGVQKSFSDEYKKIPPSGIMEVRSGNCTTKTEGGSQMHDNNSLAHTSWNCKYHVVFAPKYRRKIFYGEHKAEIGKILRELCKWKEVNIIEAEVCPDHIHMLIEIPPKLSVASFM